MSTSRPRPIGQPHREIRSQPDASEPSFSYEESFLSPIKGEDVEDDFHRRLRGSRRDSGGSFWRTTSDQNGTLSTFQSMKMSPRSDSVISSNGGGVEGRPQASGTGSTPQFQTAGDSSSPGASDQRSKKEPRKEQLYSKEKNATKQRGTARRMKLEAQNSDIDLGHLEVGGKVNGGPPLLIPPTEGSVSRSSSDHSASLLKARNNVIFGKGNSLIFPTGVDPPGGGDTKCSETFSANVQRINQLLDQCEAVRFPFKKKLILENMRLSAQDIPVRFLANTPLGNTLHKLSVSGNKLSVVPAKLVQCLPLLKTLDLSQCDLVTLPERWSLPQLRRLNLSHNRITEFPDELMLEGLPELTDLDMYGNKVTEIIVPRNKRFLSKLESLNLGYNDLAYLPEELDQIKSLRTLKVKNNFLEKVPMRICVMDLRSIDVSSNPVIQPPLETCERGICSMRRYYECLRLEEQSKHKAVEEVPKKLAKRTPKKNEKLKKNFHRLFGKSPSAGSFSSKTSLTDSERGQRDATGRVMSNEEPSILPSKPENPLLTRKRSVSFDAGMKAQVEKKQEPIENLDNNASDPELNVDEVVESLKSSLKSSASDESEGMNAGKTEEITVNDTLKVIFVGMAMAGKTSMIKRLIEGKDAEIPEDDVRTIGVDIYEWDPSKNLDRPTVDTRIELDDESAASVGKDVNVKFSVWDFAGQHVYHATHELFFSPRSLYVLVWDMGATNKVTHKKLKAIEDNQDGPFKLSYDSSDEEDDDFQAEEEARRADRALERDIDEKVQFWVECIQSCAPGAAILPVATFDDYFDGNEEEAQRRCNIMKQRLLKHEERRIEGIKERLKTYTNEKRANDEVAVRLRNLLCPYTRPKLIFGDNLENSVVRVSGTKYTGFEELAKVIADVASGRDKCGGRFPVFRGHVGARIPRMRLEVREGVRDMRERFKVVEWGYFINTLRERGLTNVEDISDALHFLANIGELSFFGSVFPDQQMTEKLLMPGGSSHKFEAEDAAHGDYDYDEFDGRTLSIDDTSITAPSTKDDGSLSFGTAGGEHFSATGLSQFVFLNPRWLVAAVACILRHDLEREIRETRRSHAAEGGSNSFYTASLNCPVITAEDACLLWQAKKFTKKAADRAHEYSNNMAVTPFDFLQRLLVRFGVFVPIDLSIEKAFLGGKEYSRTGGVGDEDKPLTEITVDVESVVPKTPQFFFLPSLLGPGEPAEAWTYKNTDSWKTTICHSILFPDGVPPGLMERITASVLSSIYAVSKGLEHVVISSLNGQPLKKLESPLRVKEILCWRTAFFLKLGTEVVEEKEVKESIVEIFVHLVDRDSNLCVGSDDMGAGMRRLVLSGKGQEGDGGRKIWNGGYLLLIKSIGRVMNEYEGLEFEKHGFCPECLAKKPASEASHWDWTVVRAAAKSGDDALRCRHGHRVDTRLITGPSDSLPKPRTEPLAPVKSNDNEAVFPLNDLLRSVVLVGLWDGKTRKVVRVGSGFIVDKKRGHIVTASHTLMNIWGDKNFPFGENYYGLREGKVVIGVIPRTNDSEESGGTVAVFRYFASIVAKDPNIEGKGECQLDACVLRITTRMENDVAGNGEGCGDQPEILLQHNPDALKREKLQQLKITEKCELDERVRILGFNQGGEGLLGPGESLNRYVDFAHGYVCKKFATGEDTVEGYRHRFKPREEIVVICPTIGGHSGGPCVNQQGEVVGILSRADPAEHHRCYLVPTHAWKMLVKRAKNTF